MQIIAAALPGSGATDCHPDTQGLCKVVDLHRIHSCYNAMASLVAQVLFVL